MAERAERGLDRLIAFSDAVVAIAMTLLILPVTELTPREGQGAVSFLYENQQDLIALAVSFAVIAQFWFAHHRIFSPLLRHDSRLALINTFWLASIVLLPFPTALTDEPGGYTTFYLATLLAASLLTTGLGAYLDRHPELTRTGAPNLRGRRWRAGLALDGPMVLALLVSLVDEDHALLLLLLIFPAQALLDRRGAVADDGRPEGTPRLSAAAAEDAGPRSTGPDPHE